MNNLSTESSAPGQEAVPGVQTGHTSLILAAWLAILLLSKLPLVIARELFGADIPFITQAWIAVAILLFSLTFILRSLEPLRGFFAVMGIILLVTAGLDPWVSQSAAWQGLFAGANPLVMLFSERMRIAVEAIIVLSALFLMGLKRQDAFLAVGDLNAPAQGIRLSGWKKPVTWIAFGTAMTLLLGGLFFAFMAIQNPAALSGIAAAFTWIPLVLLSAALNAFGEEAMYRAAPLALLLPAVGPKHSLWMTSIWFGLGHYYGAIPSGPVGFVQSGLLALLLGKAMLDTRGMGWSWIIHLAIDTVIYIFIAAMMI